MKISVIIPVYQAERFVAQAIHSACEQPEVSEVILVEDCSPDCSLEICKELVQHYPYKVKLFRHPDGGNHGAGASRNLGIKKAKGEFIAFLDADDYYLPGRFKRDIEILQNNPGVDGVYNALGVHIHDAEERQQINFNLTTVKYSIPPAKLFEEMAPIGNGGYFSGVSLTVRRTTFDKVGLFDTFLELSQDTHMWVKMAAKASLVAGIIDKPVAMRGVHTGNRVKDKAKFDYYRPLLFQSLLKWANINNISVYRKRLLWNRLYSVYVKSVNSNNQTSLLGKKIRMFLFLIKYGFSSPYLLRHGNYYSSFLQLLK